MTSKATIEKIASRIAEHFHPQRVILFGSHARGDARDDSDLDLLIIAPSDEPRWRRTVPVYRLLAGMGVPKDIVWWTPEEIAEWRGVRSHFMNRALREGRALYGRKTMKRMGLAIAMTMGCGLILALLWLLGRPVEPARAADLCADSYASIQEAISNANDGDTVRVPTGLYTETLVITESIVLQGGWNSGCSSRATTDPAQTVINGEAAGSVVSVEQGTPTLESLTLTGGRNNKGGGVYVDSASPTLDNVVVSGNVVSTTINEWTLGAGVYMGRWSTITLSQTDIVSNTAYAYPGQIALGGGLYLDVGSSANLTATRIMSNVYASGTDLRGGGVYIESGAALVFHGTENLIAYNRAWYGGGIRLTAYSSISRVAIMNNTALVYGGGMAVYSGSGGVIANNIIAGNSANSQGSGLYFWYAQMEVANNTVAGNLGGVGVAMEMGGNTVPTLTNNIVVSHTVGIYNRSTTVSPTLVTNDVWGSSATNYQGVLTGVSDIHVDPLFVNPGGGNYHLASGSPVADVGTTVSWLTTDFDGDRRPIGTGYDIGADEARLNVYLPLVMRSYTP